MTPEQFAEVTRLFEACIGLPALERAEHARASCTDPEVLRKVEAMLAADADDAADGDSARVDAPALGVPALGVPALGPGFHVGNITGQDDRLFEEIESEGRYRVDSIVGEGGFGTVLRAEQLEPVRRTVAMKIIKLGMDSSRIVARFESERQTLALMEHPGIARLFDAGALPSGRPYFVMEFVDGKPITRHCREAGLGVAERLRLFVEVCHAVQHAHQRGIIHRDLKPSNVLVSETDRTGGTAGATGAGGVGGGRQPKVIDFGIARATTDTDAPGLTLTEPGQPIGTLGYMSPEQAAGERDIDTRTDIYSLGAMLYEILTGTTPLGRAAEGPPAEQIRSIREIDPPRPSRHDPALAGDLDWIVMTAIDKSRERRYASVGALADDVTRYLTDEPIMARPPSRRYRLAKFARRNKAGIGVAGLVLLALVGTTFGLVRSLRAEARARTEAMIATEINTFLNDDLLAAAAPEELGSDVRVRDVLGIAAERVESRFGGLPEVEAALRLTLGRTYARLADYEHAEHQLGRSRALNLERYGPGDPRTLRAVHELGQLRTLMDRYAESETLLREAFAGRRRVLGTNHPDTLSSQFALAIAVGEQARFDEAEGLFVDVLGRSRRVLGPDHEQTLVRVRGLGMLYLSTGELDKARPLFEEAHERMRETLGVDNPATLLVMQALASVLRAQGEPERALGLLTEALEVSRSVRGVEHPGTLMTMGTLGSIYAALGDAGRAEEMLDSAANIARSALPPGHSVTTRLELNLADLYASQERYELAEPLLLGAIATQRDQLGDDHPTTRRSVGTLIEHYKARGMDETAEEWATGRR